MPPGDAAAVLAVIGLSADPAGDELPLGVCVVALVCVWVEDEEVVDVEGPAGRRGAGEEAVWAAGAQLEQRLRGVGKVGEEHRRGFIRGEGVRVLHRGGGGGGVMTTCNCRVSSSLFFTPPWPHRSTSHSLAVSGTQASSSSSPSASQVSTATAATAHPTARGKTHISRALERYLRWLGVKTRVYSIGDYRRKVLGGAENVPHDYFQTKSVCSSRFPLAF